VAGVLLAGPDRSLFKVLEDVFSGRPEIDLNYASSGAEALRLAGQGNMVLAVADEGLGDMSGLDFVRELLMVNAMINSAVVSSLSHDDFHEASEGLGIMVQLSSSISRREAEDLLSRLESMIPIAGP
jgi:DNA-binding response OmpR family regulator